jgi:redox-sensitive bicupin YhaK (pirin superfamily)
MIEQTLTPVTHDLGAFKVRRVLPARERTMVGPFIFVDEFGPAQMAAGEGMDVRPHPHINLATVTYLFDGAIQHKDSLGNDQRIEPGAINLMTAGKGIVHSERSPADTRRQGPSFYGMQTWLALPDGKEEGRSRVRARAVGQSAFGRGRGRVGPGADGNNVGSDRRYHLPFADHLCRSATRCRH